jgi:translation elongation factor EF-Tu-like GTPase
MELRLAMSGGACAAVTAGSGGTYVPVDDPRLFVLRNGGVVATRRAESGSLRVGDAVQINDDPTATVQGIEVSRKSLDEANAGDTVGVLLGGMDGSQFNSGEVLTPHGTYRGDVPRRGITAIGARTRYASARTCASAGD